MKYYYFNFSYLVSLINPNFYSTEELYILLFTNSSNY